MRDRPRTPPPVPSQLPIDPRMAARWVAVRRDRHRRRMRLLMGTVSVLTVLVGAWLLTRSPLLAVRQVDVRGTGHTAAAAVLAATGLDRHPPMLGVDVGGIRRRVEALPWVARATVQREWPTTLAIVITERTPVAQIQGSVGQPAVVDAAGRVLAVGPNAAGVLAGAHPPLASLQGLPPAGPAGSSLASSATAPLAMLRALQALVAELPSRYAGYAVATVARGDDGTVRASLAPGRIDIILGSPDQLTAKLVALRSVLAQLPLASSATIDVRVADAPVLTAGVLTAGKNSSSLSTTQRG